MRRFGYSYINPEIVTNSQLTPRYSLALNILGFHRDSVPTFDQVLKAYESRARELITCHTDGNVEITDEFTVCLYQEARDEILSIVASMQQREQYYRDMLGVGTHAQEVEKALAQVLAKWMSPENLKQEVFRIIERRLRRETLPLARVLDALEKLDSPLLDGRMRSIVQKNLWGVYRACTFWMEHMGSELEGDVFTALKEEYLRGKIIADHHKAPEYLDSLRNVILPYVALYVARARAIALSLDAMLQPGRSMKKDDLFPINGTTYIELYKYLESSFGGPSTAQSLLAQLKRDPELFYGHNDFIALVEEVAAGEQQQKPLI